MKLRAGTAMRLCGLMITEAIEREIRDLTSAEYHIEAVEDPNWGRIYVVMLRSDAREALRVWLELQKRHPGLPLLFRWTGSAHVTREELIEYLLEIAKAGGFKPKAPPDFNAVSEVADGRDRSL